MIAKGIPLRARNEEGAYPSVCNRRATQPSAEGPSEGGINSGEPRCKHGSTRHPCPLTVGRNCPQDAPCFDGSPCWRFQGSRSPLPPQSPNGALLVCSL